MAVSLGRALLFRSSIFYALATLLLLQSGCARYNYYPRGVHHANDRQLTAGMYDVQPGDTLYGIAKRAGLDYKLLASRNGIRPPYTIYVGQKLFLKAKALSSAKLPISKSKREEEHAKKHGVANQSATKFLWPVEGRLSSQFGPRNNRMHDGIDIAAQKGADVRASAAGLVVYADSRLTGYGNLIIIRHSRDLFTAYAHNQKNLVKRGDEVRSGQLIALVGTSGRSTGPHLHFEVRRGETAVNPLAYLPKR